jgi:RNA polymerase sigma-70 factor (ECF subfamily)
MAGFRAPEDDEAAAVMPAVGTDLMARAMAGDQSALDGLLRALLKPAYKLAYLMLGDREAAEDAVQSAALSSWRKLAKLRPGSDPRPWFMGFVANECRNMRRSRWRSVLRLGSRDDIVAPSPTWVSDLDLQRALARLSHEDRLVVLLHFYLGMSIAEVAIVTRSGTAAARSQVYRAVKRLRRHLGDAEAGLHG